MRKLVVGLVLAMLLTLAAVVPASAVVHAVTPSDECSGGDGGGVQAVQNGGISGIDPNANPADVGNGPVPANNPGESTGTGVGGTVPAACT